MLSSALILLCISAFSAGMIDAMAGGGGLIQLPMLFLVLPQMPIPSLLGINKFASIAGTCTAMLRYMRSVPLRWKSLVPTALSAFFFSLLGARAVSVLPNHFLKPLMLVMMLLVLTYTLIKKQWGDVQQLRFNKLKNEQLVGIFIGAGLGFYDGFFGPGTGSFSVALLIGVLGFDFLRATASTKVINASTNLAALIIFITGGYVVYHIAVPMALCNMLGGWCGSHLALKKGNRFIRIIFILVVLAMIIRLVIDM